MTFNTNQAALVLDGYAAEAELDRELLSEFVWPFPQSQRHSDQGSSDRMLPYGSGLLHEYQPRKSSPNECLKLHRNSDVGRNCVPNARPRIKLGAKSVGRDTAPGETSGKTDKFMALTNDRQPEMHKINRRIHTGERSPLVGQTPPRAEPAPLSKLPNRKPSKRSDLDYLRP